MPLQIIRQDITKMKVDAIVNTTNEKMIGYSGVDLAVHTAAGHKLDEECAALAPLQIGKAKITKGYNLDAKYIIHTSGPVWRGGSNREEEQLKSCYTESLKIAAKNKCSSVAFPLISSGSYGYPKDKVLKTAIQIITEFLFKYELTVYLCVFDKTSYEFSQKLYTEISEFIDDDYAEEYISDKCESSFFETYESGFDDENETHFLKEHLKDLPEDCGEPQRSSPSRKPKRTANDHNICMPPVVQAMTSGTVSENAFYDYMKEMDKSFAYKLFDMIDKRGMTDVECYKKANVDKKTFSKIKCNPDTYRPSKQTAVAFAIALRLNLEETQSLLASAGLTLSRSFVFDKIIMYFIKEKIYNIFEINEALFEFDQVLLGC